ncbi:autotransporter secretion outer membrane protein TamA [Roseibium suaedae]|uniref:Autotransporter secretion outer membrane protein TamA n=2 Tax=Roseibium suaedae TaxID=735517 RepID=A0A1M7D319_9HYPH|nr:autotransporter secretion outer membrane protein TamA [Roseibium suaedae]
MWDGCRDLSDIVGLSAQVNVRKQAFFVRNHCSEAPQNRRQFVNCLPSPSPGPRSGDRQFDDLLRPLRKGTMKCAFALGVSMTALMAALAVPSSPAQAFELFGLHLWGEKAEATQQVPDPIAYSVRLDMPETETETGTKDLRKDLEATSTLFTRSEELPSGEAGLISRSLSDLDRLVARLYAHGLYGGVVDITLNGRPLQQALETGDIPGGQPVETVITVSPGPEFTFGQIAIKGDLPPEDAAEEPSFGLVPGEQAASTRILSAEQKMALALKKQGYPKAEVSGRDIVADHATKKLDVTLTVATGPRARFGAVTVKGTEVTEPDFVISQAMIPVGETYSPQALESARKRLNELGIFSSIQLVEGEVDPVTGDMPVTIEVTERKRHVIGAGTSWSSTEGFGVEAYWRRRNLFGRGELLSIEGSAGQIGNASATDMEYAARIALEKPGVFGPLTKFTTSLGAKQEVPDAYKSRSVTLDGYLSRTFTDTLTGRAGGEIFFADEEDAYGKDKYLLVGLPADLTFDNRDDKLDPSKGIYAALAVEPAYDTLQSHAMFFVKGTASSYVALDEAKRFILAGRVSAGSIIAPSVDDVPASRRMIAGGGGSIRGYAYRNVGPRLNGTVTGGRSLLEASGELRVKITETLGVVAFVDAGNAYSDSIPDFSEPLKIGTGIGLRYYTPIGPLRVDLAMPLDPEKDDPDYALYVGLSQAF